MCENLDSPIGESSKFGSSESLVNWGIQIFMSSREFKPPNFEKHRTSLGSGPNIVDKVGNPEILRTEPRVSSLGI